ncbi:MAG: hypothetical protein OXU85_02970 [Thaumarchaeota archaeon]|nr:hypothetical protein [Nitrososphaerota archaeon]
MNTARWSDRGLDMQVAIMLAVIGAITVATVWTGTVRDLGTAGSLSSVLGFGVTVFIFWIARQLSRRVRRTRMGLLRRDDLRNRNHMIVTLNLCRSLVQGAEGEDPASPVALSAMRHTAQHIGEFGTTYEYLLTEWGKMLAEDLRVTALAAIAGKSCAAVDTSSMLDSLDQLEGEILDIDSEELVRRREQEVGAEDSR